MAHRGDGSPGDGMSVGRRLRLGLAGAVARHRSERARERRAKHLDRTELAAAEAVAEDPAFDAVAIRAQAAQLFLDVQTAWDRRDADALAGLVAPGLLADFKRRWADLDGNGWRARIKVLSPPEVELIHIHNAADDREDRVCVHVSARVDDYVVAIGGHRIMREVPDEVQRDEYWHLRRTPSGWCLEAIEDEAEGAYNLTQTNVATPWADEAGLHDEAVAERAGAETAPYAPAELADLDFAGPARAKAMDLSLADGRFDVDLIEASVRRVIAAWMRAVDGDDDALADVARPTAADALLYPDDPTRTVRLVVRGAEVLAVRISELEPDATPPYLWVQVDVRGRYYLEHCGTRAVVGGSRSRPVKMTERWTLTLGGEGTWPWRLGAVGATSPA